MITTYNTCLFLGRRKAEIIEAFNSMSRYSADKLNLCRPRNPNPRVNGYCWKRGLLSFRHNPLIRGLEFLNLHPRLMIDYCRTCFSKVRYRRLVVFRPSVCSSVSPSVRPSVRPSVHNIMSTLTFKFIHMTYSLKPLHP